MSTADVAPGVTAAPVSGGNWGPGATTKSLLGYGVIAGPIYLTVGLAQALTREGFALSRHPLSVLSNGPGGWIQTTNFVLTGLMVIAAAIGIKRALGSSSRGVPWFLGAFGLSMLLAAVFKADPVDGFPVGTPLGPPTTSTTAGMLHFLAGTIGFVCLAIACLRMARAMKNRGEAGLGTFSTVAGITVLVGFFGGAALATTSAGVMGIWLSVVTGWIWLALVSINLYRATENPDCLPAR